MYIFALIIDERKYLFVEMDFVKNIGGNSCCRETYPKLVELITYCCLKVAYELI